MFELKVITHFAAAHQLQMVAKKCENLHGHNWKVEVYIAGDELNDAGVIIDLGEIKRHLADIKKSLDHRFLNELECFQNGNPSSENIARFIAKTMQEKISAPGI
ncbi:MAG: 6-carboxytetrahydropterin synthase QueD, partial [Desulfobacterales bacterium]|nr:6-carboxytetrahydropterin synthase QueD [Desulfobacterales bacterium]